MSTEPLYPLPEAGVPGIEISEIAPTDRKEDNNNSSLGSGQSPVTIRNNNDEDGEKDGAVNDDAANRILPLSRARKIALVVTVTGAALMNTMSVQAAVIILPTIGRDLNIPSARQQWIISSYALAFGCFLLLWGRLADVYGKRPIFVLGSAWGLGGAANVPTAIGILGVTFEPGKAKNYAFATFSAGAPMGAILGNIMSGLVAEYATWKWVFWILAIIAAATTIAGHFLIPLPTMQPSEGELKNAIDWVGGTVVTVALFILLFALTEANTVGWSTPYIPTIIVVSVLLLIGFVLWQLYLEKRTVRRPLVKISLFTRKRVAASFFVMAMFFSSFSNYLIFVTYYFQDYKGAYLVIWRVTNTHTSLNTFWKRVERADVLVVIVVGLSPLQTTIRFIPTGVSGSMRPNIYFRELSDKFPVCTIFVTSQILSRVPVNFIVMFGTLCLITCTLLFAVPIPPDTTYWAFAFPSLCLCVMGADTLFPSLILFNSHSLPKEDQALGGGLINAVGQIFRAIGLAIGIALQVAVQESHQKSDNKAVTGTDNLHNPAFLAGLRAGQWLSVGLSGAAFVVVVFVFKGAGVMGRAK